MAAASPDAIALLKADHKKVASLFAQFEAAKGAERRKRLATQICTELTIHTTIEEEIFYPAVRKAIEDSDLMDEALVEHAGAKDLIAQLEDAAVDDDLYKAKVTVLGEQIDHHVKEEESSMFPKAQKAKVDMAALGAKMTQRKTALMEEMGVSNDDAEQEESTSKAKKTAKR